MYHAMTAFYLGFTRKSFAALTDDLKNPPVQSNLVFAWLQPPVEVSSLARAIAGYENLISSTSAQKRIWFENSGSISNEAPEI
jgi:hydroxyacyl-ACP dehydratase HTD2-like protein with hotdog domain